MTSTGPLLNPLQERKKFCIIDKTVTLDGRKSMRTRKLSYRVHCLYITTNSHRRAKKKCMCSISLRIATPSPSVSPGGGGGCGYT